MNRRVSWLMGALAYVAPPTLVYFGQASLYASAKADDHYVCGLPILAMTILASLGAATLSGIAFVFGWLSYRRLPKPRPGVRGAELAVLAVPMFLGVVLVAILFSV